MIKCTECGTESLKQEKICPNCGSCAELVVEDIKEDDEKEDVLDVYNIWGYELEVDEKMNDYIRTNRVLFLYRENFITTANNEYSQYGNIDELLKKFPKFYNAVLDYIIRLYDQSEFLDKDQFLEQYSWNLDVDQLLEPIVTRYLEIHGLKSLAIQYKEYIRQYKCYGQSENTINKTNFNNKYFKAETLPIEISWLCLESTLNSDDSEYVNNEDIKIAKTELYEDENTKNILINAMRTMIDSFIEYVCNAITSSEKKSFIQVFYFDKEKVIEILNNLKSYMKRDEKDDIKIKEMLLEAFKADPSNKEVIENMLSICIPKEDEDLIRYAKNYGFWDDYEKYSDKAKKEVREVTEKEQKKNVINLCDDLIEKSRIIDNSDLFKILEQFYNIACKNPDVYVEEYVKKAIEIRLNHYIGLNDINTIREKAEKIGSQYGYSKSLNKYIDSALESVEKKVDKRYKEYCKEAVNEKLECLLQKRKIMSGYQAISVGGTPEYTVGVMALDGTVVSTRFKDWGNGEDENEKYLFKYWENIDSVLVGNNGTYGLKGDGTVVVAGGYYPKRQVENWKDIVAIANTFEFLAGLKQDGTVVITYCRDEALQREIQKWENIVSIAGRGRVLVGLRNDGTVVAVGDSNFGTTEACEVDGWKDIVYVSTNGLCTFGVKENGKVVVTPLHWKNSAFPYTANAVENWEDIVAISSGEWHTVGLKSDGTVVAVGYNDFNQCNVHDWKNIVSIATGNNCTVGLKSDGTMIAVGDNSDGQCNLQRWRNLDVLPEITSLDEWLNYKKQRSDKRIKICNIRKQRRTVGVCQYCGKPFKGFILKNAVDAA